MPDGRNRGLRMTTCFQQPYSELDMQLAWAAGFIDGEGCIQASRNSSKTSEIRPMISVGQADHPACLERLRTILDAGSVYRPRTQNIRGKKTMFVWSASGATQCYRVLISVMPLMIVKQDQARELLRLVHLIFARKQGTRKLTDAEYEARLAILINLQEMKKPRPVSEFPDLLPKPSELLPCGTDAAYMRGCRCDSCRAAHAARARLYKLRKAEANMIDVIARTA